MKFRGPLATVAVLAAVLGTAVAVWQAAADGAPGRRGGQAGSPTATRDILQASEFAAVIVEYCMMTFRVEIEQEEDGRWIAEVTDLSGVLAYGQTQEEAKAKVQALALRVIADRLEHGEAGPDLVSISFAAA